MGATSGGTGLIVGGAGFLGDAFTTAASQWLTRFPH
jgi:hypothetical protein